jgi:hypothetical protein
MLPLYINLLVKFYSTLSTPTTILPHCLSAIFILKLVSETAYMRKPRLLLGILAYTYFLLEILECRPIESLPENIDDDDVESLVSMFETPLEGLFPCITGY